MTLAAVYLFHSLFDYDPVGGGCRGREQQTHDKGDEAEQCGHRWAGCGALVACYLGVDVVVRALGCVTHLFFVAADFFSERSFYFFGHLLYF